MRRIGAVTCSGDLVAGEDLVEERYEGAAGAGLVPTWWRARTSLKSAMRGRPVQAWCRPGGGRGPR